MHHDKLAPLFFVFFLKTSDVLQLLSYDLSNCHICVINFLGFRRFFSFHQNMVDQKNCKTQNCCINVYEQCINESKLFKKTRCWKEVSHNIVQMKTTCSKEIRKKDLIGIFLFLSGATLSFIINEYLTIHICLQAKKFYFHRCFFSRS